MDKEVLIDMYASLTLVKNTIPKMLERRSIVDILNNYHALKDVQEYFSNKVNTDPKGTYWEQEIVDCCSESIEMIVNYFSTYMEKFLIKNKRL